VGGAVMAVFTLPAFLNGAAEIFARLAGAFLDATNEFIFFAFGELEVIMSELRKLLFKLAHHDVPIAFNLECCHIRSMCLVMV
jgi:hypothetical protein